MTHPLFLTVVVTLAACGKPITSAADPVTPSIYAPTATSAAPQPPADRKPQPAPTGRPEVWSYKVVATYPHGERFFTQGLFIHDGAMYETTGQFGESAIIRHGFLGDATPAEMPLPVNVFGEGSVAVGDKIISVTWREGVGHVHDVTTLERLATFPLAGEGWGLTYDGEKLILSDGTDRLRYLSPSSYEELGSIPVRFGDRPVSRLNELEMVRGEIWANIWQTDVIARIRPSDGEVLGFVNLAGISPENAGASNNVLNGIAYDSQADRLFVTGKRWANIYEIEIVKK